MCDGTHPFIPADTGVKVEIRMQQDTQLVENVIWVDVGHAPLLTDVTNVAAIVSAWYGAHLTSAQSNTVRGIGVIATGWDSAEGFRFEDNTIAGATGGNTTAPLPNAVTLAIHWATDSRGRSRQGHITHVGLTEDMTVGNRVTDTVAGILLAVYQDLTLAIQTAGWTQVVASFCNDKVWRTTALLTPITTAVLRDTVLDQAIRRKPGRGR